jgi:hypothetical protein
MTICLSKGLAMKIISQSGTQLVIEDRPWLIGIMMIAMLIIFLGGSLFLFSQGEILGGSIMGLVGTGVPLLIFVLMVQRVRLTFDRARGQLTRTRKSVFGLTEKSYALSRLSRAFVGVSHGDDGNTYRLELQLSGPDEVVPFTTYHTSGSKPERLASAVNDWLARG